MDCEKDWQKTVLHVERAHEARNKTTKGWTAIQGKELRKRFHDDAKFGALVAKRQSQGLFYEDEDFPGDVDETQLIQILHLFW